MVYIVTCTVHIILYYITLHYHGILQLALYIYIYIYIIYMSLSVCTLCKDERTLRKLFAALAVHRSTTAFHC